MERGNFLLKVVKSILSLFTLFVLLQGFLYAGTVSFREKKKTIERKFRILEESRKVIPFQKQEENWKKLSYLSDRFQSSVRSDLVRKREVSLLLLERALPLAAADFTQEGNILAKNLILFYADGYSQRKKHPKENQTTSIQEEKAATYFRMAKEELNQAEKFDRDGNDFYALVLYGRSIQYSLSAFQTVNLEIPNDYIGVLKKETSKTDL